MFAPVVHRVEELPSMALVGGDPPHDCDAVGTHPVRDRAISVPPSPLEEPLLELLVDPPLELLEEPPLDELLLLPPPLYTLISAIDHQLLADPVWTMRMYRNVWVGNVTVTSAPAPAPVAIGLPQVMPSLETKTW
jgi:hypothetical protein